MLRIESTTQTTSYRRQLARFAFFMLLTLVTTVLPLHGQTTALVNQPMASATFVNIYWDSSWDSDDSSLPMATIDNVTQAVISSSYFKGLGEYGVNSVSFGGSFLPASHCPQKAPDSVGFYDPINTSIAGFIQCEHDRGPALLRQSGVVYNIILPPSSIESDFWSMNFCAGAGSPVAWHYHGLEDTPPWPFGGGPFSGPPIYTIIQANTKCGGNTLLFDSLLHEMVEAVTDPSPVDISIIPPHVNFGITNEIADLCEGMDVRMFLAGIPVIAPSYKSNKNQTCINFIRRIGVLKQDGNLFVKEGALNAPWVWESSNVRSFALERDRIGVLQNDGTLYVKEGPLDALWTAESWNVQSFALKGNRIGVLLSNSSVYVKEGPLDALWTAESWNVQSFALEDNRIGVLQNDGTLYVKEGPLDALWTAESWNVQSFALSGGRIGVLNASPDHTVYVKEGPLNALWAAESSNVRSFALEGTRIGVLNASPDHTVFVKEGSLYALWTAESSNVQSFALNGDRIGVLNASPDHTVFVKEGPLNALWTAQKSSIQSFVLSGDRIGVLDVFGGSASLFVKEGPLGADCPPGSCTPTSNWLVETGLVNSFALSWY